jgi:FkbM family methyltransferase
MLRLLRPAATARPACDDKEMKRYQKTIAKLLKMTGLLRDELSLESILLRRRNSGMMPHTVLDIGSSNGCWTLRAIKIFPEAQYLLVEAQKEHEAALARVKKNSDRIDYVIAAAGDYNGAIYFDDSDLFGGVASHVPVNENCRTVPVRTIDSIVKEVGLKPPFLLKLDTHGFEVPIFAGAYETLGGTCIIIVETYNFRIERESLRFHEMCAFMEERGFRCIDICEPIHRPLDDAFWQFDLVFIPATSDEFRSNSYR